MTVIPCVYNEGIQVPEIIQPKNNSDFGPSGRYHHFLYDSFSMNE